MYPWYVYVGLLMGAILSYAALYALGWKIALRTEAPVYRRPGKRVQIGRKIGALLLVGLLTPLLIPQGSGAHDDNDFFVPDFPLGFQIGLATGPAGAYGIGNVPNAQVDGGLLFRRNGPNNWQPIQLPPTDEASGLEVTGSNAYVGLNGIGPDTAASNPTGPFGRITGGTTVTYEPVGGLGTVNAIRAFSDSDIWVAGEPASSPGGPSDLYHWDGSTWSLILSAYQSNVDLRRLFVAGPSDLFFTRTFSGPSRTEVWRSDGVTAWEVTTHDLPVSLGTTIWGTSSTNLFFGAGTTLYRSTDEGANWIAHFTVATVTTGVSVSTGIISIDGFGAEIWLFAAPLIYRSGDSGATFTQETGAGPAATFSSVDKIAVGGPSEIYTGAFNGTRRWQVNPPVPPPTLGVANVHRPDTLSVSQAQCNGDQISFTVAVETTALISLADMDVYVVRVSDNVILEQIDDSAMFDISGQAFYFSRAYPAGVYAALAVVDLAGINAVNFFALHSFNVPSGSCISIPTDLSPVLGALTAARAEANASHAATRTAVLHYTNQTDSYVNLTRADIADWVATVGGNLNFTVNGTGFQDLLNSTFEAQSQPIADSITDAAAAWLAVFLLLLLIAWAEWSRDLLLYVIAILTGAAATLFLWDEMVGFRFVYVAATLLLTIRAYLRYQEIKEGNQE